MRWYDNTKNKKERERKEKKDKSNSKKTNSNPPPIIEIQYIFKRSVRNTRNFAAKNG